MEKEYLPHAVEERWIARWEEADLFRADPASERPPFCMVIPPPNVTGNLHIGHVLVYTLHDVVARWQRMRGADVLWLPGTDHAGIATQMVVERELAKEGRTRHDLGREAFERRVWEWKEQYGGNITRALRLLGASCDWSRERFTLDEGLSKAVREVFVRLYREDRIYRDRYIVNWCPRCHTAISDLETVSMPIEGRLYTIRYPVVGSHGGEVRVATTRPETLLGDTAIAVHPDDERYRELVGARVRVPLTDREIPVLADDFVDPKFGTGAVKITPAHDPNDFAAGRRHGLEEIVVIDNAGKMTPEAGSYAGLDRFEARTRVVADLETQKLLVKTRKHDHAVGHCQRCGTMIEPLVSRQWFVRVGPMAEEAIRAVETSRTRFVPDNWSKTYFEWMRNIHDWCISRQLWWGHRIPAWYCDRCDEVFVADSAPESCSGCSGALRQDEDVLDTWFSSALWPFSTLGWPDETAELERYYPTNLLITGHDIIFFWVARMMMMGLHFRGDVPFDRVYIHGLVRDAHGQKMSKSKGNTVDPFEVQDRYGTDAVRFTMAILAAPGNDIPLAPERMEGYRAFANKLWNAVRFVLMKVGDEAAEPLRREELTLADRWILSRTQATLREVDRALEAFRFDRAADALYQFAWRQFCDWYIEFVKPAFPAEPEPSGDDRRRVARSVLLEVLSSLLRMLHPFMPFLTEELWSRHPANAGFLAVESWPRPREEDDDPEAERQVETLQQLVVKVRNLRADTNIDPSQRVDLLLHAGSESDRALLESERALVGSLVRAGDVRLVEAIDEKLVAARGVVAGIQLAIPLEGLLDFESERARLGKDLLKTEKDLAGRSKKLNNSSFLERAPADVVDKERRLQAELLERKHRLEEHLRLIGGAPGEGS